MASPRLSRPRCRMLASCAVDARRTFASTAASPPLRVGRAAAATLTIAGSCVYLSERDSIHADLSADNAEDVDALIIGGGIMGTTVAVMLKLLQPSWNILLIEQLDRVGAESSNEWHNAGTGHAALCEANYTPIDRQTGEVDISKARAVNQKFNVSLCTATSQRLSGCCLNAVTRESSITEPPSSVKDCANCRVSRP